MRGILPPTETRLIDFYTVTLLNMLKLFQPNKAFLNVMPNTTHK